MKRPVKRHEVVQPLDTSYRLISLTQGQNAIVDLGDFEYLSRWPWYAQWNPHTKSFYAKRNSRPNSKGKRTCIRMHSVILGLKIGEEGDHKNHDTLDNRLENLRKSTQTQNLHNTRTRAKNSSGYKGVSWHKGTEKWCAQIQVSDKKKHLGLFSSPEDAARAYDKAARTANGEFAFLNFPMP